MRRWVILIVAVTFVVTGQKFLSGDEIRPHNRILNADVLESYVEKFNTLDDELYIQGIPNARALTFLKNNIPLFECPDKQLEEVYYFRWWHIASM